MVADGPAVRRLNAASVAGVPALVGRETELGVMRSWVESASHGRPVVAVCVGEPGIGKTRLAQEVSVAARSAGFSVGWSVCDDLEGAPPFWPWLQLLRQFDDESSMARSALEPIAYAIEAFSGAGARTQQGDVEERFQRFEVVAQALRDASASVPLLIVLDDVQWMDEASVLLLQHIVRGLRSERVCLLITVREGDPRARVVTAELLRSPFANELVLRGLDGVSVREYLEGAGVTATGAADVEFARAVTGGNPLFLAEYARWGGGDRLSRTVRETIARRVQALPPQNVRVLGAAAVLGRTFSVVELADLLGISPVSCRGHVEDLENAGLIESMGPTHFRFGHALVRDAVEALLAHDDRAALHAGAARVARARPDGDLFVVAHHLAEAAAFGDAQGAMAAVWQAADEAMRRLAFETAARLYALAESLGASSLEPRARFDLLVHLMRAAHDSGQLGQRLDAGTRAAALARELDSAERLATVALAMPPVGGGGFDLATRRLCMEALERLGEQDPRLRALLWACFAETFHYQADAFAGRDASRRALELAEETGDPHALMAACHSFQVLFAGPDDLDSRAAVASRMREVADTTRDARDDLAARAASTTILLERGDLDGAADEVAAMAASVEVIATPGVRSQWLWAQGTLAQARGQVAEARRLADAAVAAAGPTEHPGPRHSRAALLGNLGRHAGQDAESLQASTNSASPKTRDGPPVIAAVALAHNLATGGCLSEAATVYDSLGPPRVWRPAPHVVLLCAAFGVAVASALDRIDDLPVFVARLAPYRGHHVVSGIGAVAYLGPVELWLGTAARHLGDLDAAIVDLETAIESCEGNGAVGFRADAELELAAALIARSAHGDAGRSRQLIAHAAAAADAHDMPALRARADALRASPAGVAWPLTRRESEVAALVAAGLTNRQIGERLHLSERTAQNHVQHVLDKLGFNTRSAIAAWVVAHTREQNE